VYQYGRYYNKYYLNEHIGILSEISQSNTAGSDSGIGGDISAKERQWKK